MNPLFLLFVFLVGNTTFTFSKLETCLESHMPSLVSVPEGANVEMG